MRQLTVLGTPLVLTDYGELLAELHQRVRAGGCFAVEFANTHVVTLRRHDENFRKLTSRFDYFIPDGMPLIWCLNALGAELKDRVYGPTFMRRAMASFPAPFRHYFLGGSPECSRQLRRRMTKLQPELVIAGGFDGRVTEENTPLILQEINRLRPDFIWVALGAPRQETWIGRHKERINQGILLSVGFAFDVNAGTKPDAPLWMQRIGLTWLFRLASEPRRVWWRYVKYNTLFLCYLFAEPFSARPK